MEEWTLREMPLGVLITAPKGIPIMKLPRLVHHLLRINASYDLLAPDIGEYYGVWGAATSIALVEQWRAELFDTQEVEKCSI